MRPFRLGMPWAVMAALLLLGLLITLFGHVRFGGSIMAFGLFAGAFMRATFPDRFVRDIAVRSRTADIVAYGGLGVLVMVGVFTLKL